VDNASEIEILLNGTLIGNAPKTANDAWGGVQAITLPDAFVNDSSDNYLTFNNTANPPNKWWWGVRKVSVEEGASGGDTIPLPSAAAYGNIKGGDQSRINEVNYRFGGLSGDVTLYYEAWDVDNASEIEILLNGTLIGNAPETANDAWGGLQSITMADALVNDSSDNYLTFNNTANPPNKWWWGVKNVSVDDKQPPPLADIDGDRISDLQVGELQIDHNWQYVEFKNAYVDPIVIANSMSLNGSDPAVIRIRKVGQSGFEIRVQEWDYLDGWHKVEAASYLVIEHGSYTLADGTKVEAGLFETAKTGSFGRIRFSQTFQTTPVVMASVSSFNGAQAVTARLRNIDPDGFDFCMQEQEGNAQIHNTETIGYIAWEPSMGTVDGLMFEVGKTGDSVSHDFYTVQFAQNFGTTPLFIAAMQTSDGMDTASIRWHNNDAYAVEIQIDEEQSNDSEVNHTTEVVGYMVFSR
jgi:archaellum component FlaF (FlaF/FlaG flagellin family)